VGADARSAGDGHVSIKAEAYTTKKKLLEDLATSLPPEPAEPQPVGHGEDDKGLFDRVKDIFG
jgi:hypothetical protein